MIRSFLALFCLCVSTATLVAENRSQQEPLSSHQLRFVNTSGRTVQSITIGDLLFSGIRTESATEYQDVKSGSFRIKGRYSGQGHVYLDGRISIPAGPFRKWTVTLNKDRRFVVGDDTPRRAESQSRTANRLVNRLRFHNDFGQRVISITMGPITFRNVPPGATTPYRSITPGSYEVAGEVEGFGPESLATTFTIREIGNKRFTQTLNASGRFTLSEDP